MVVRTPPDVSLYHRFENPLFGRVLDRLAASDAQSVVLPRTQAQRAELLDRRGFVVPERAIDAQSLVAYADLVISAGGTMNREAVALGTPVFTTFEGRLGAVDEALLRDGRLRKLDDPGQIEIGTARAERRLAHPARSARTSHNAARRPRIMRSLPSSVNVRRAGQVGVDALLLALAYYLAYYLRFDDGIPGKYADLLADTIWLTVPMQVAIFAAFGLYSKLWRFVDQKDFETILKATVVSTAGLIVVLFLFSIGRHDPPRSVIALDFLLVLVFACGARFAVRAAFERPARGSILERAGHEVLIVGAGNGGQQVASELRRNPGLRSAPVGFVDDDPRKQGMRVAGYKVLGTTDGLPRVLDAVKPDEVIIAIPSAPGILRQRVVTACRERAIPVRMLPTTFELLSGGLNLMRQVRQVQVEDVLGREPVRVEIDRVGAYLSGRVVLVTGAGGSIGAELCRQIARVGPKLLVLVENSENALFEIRRELEEERHFARAAPVLADCKDATRVREVFEEHSPSVVFHAAAYKHVPLMEENPVEAVRNNAVATRIVAAAAGEAGVERFVLVSTDKAVSPATVMGASKALAEWAVEAAQNRWKGTRYASVRFGNVLGSSGSVVPIFRRQIAAGRAGDRHRRAHDALLHDDPRGGAADHPLRRAVHGRRGVRARDGRPGQDPRPGGEHDPPGRLRARRRHRDRGRRPPAGGEDPRGAVQPGRAAAADARGEDRLRRPAADRPAVGGERLRADRGARLRRRRGGPGGRGRGAVGRARAGRRRAQLTRQQVRTPPLVLQFDPCRR